MLNKSQHENQSSTISKTQEKVCRATRNEPCVEPLPPGPLPCESFLAAGSLPVNEIEESE